MFFGCPRVVMAVIYFCTTWFSQAYGNAVFWPFLGFLFMPFTTLAVMASYLNNNNSVSGWWYALVVVAVLMDLGSNGSSVQSRR